MIEHLTEAQAISGCHGYYLDVHERAGGIGSVFSRPRKLESVPDAGRLPT